MNQWDACLWFCDFSCRTGECLSRVTPHKLADNLFLCLLICLPDNLWSLSTLSFPLGPVIRSPPWAPSSCSYCGRLHFYGLMMSVTTQALWVSTCSPLVVGTLVSCFLGVLTWKSHYCFTSVESVRATEQVTCFTKYNNSSLLVLNCRWLKVYLSKIWNVLITY